MPTDVPEDRLQSEETAARVGRSLRTGVGGSGGLGSDGAGSGGVTFKAKCIKPHKSVIFQTTIAKCVSLGLCCVVWLCCV